MDAFDADALIYAAVADHDLGRRVAALVGEASMAPGDPPAGLGTVLLLPELLTKPLREDAGGEFAALAAILARLDLRPLDQATAELSVALGAAHRLRAADAVHLATAVISGADRFITNNRRDFPNSIDEINITYPIDLPDPTDGSA